MSSSAKANKINVLVVFANPRNTDPLRLGTEDRVIREAIQLSPHRDRISITVRHAATIHDLRRALLADMFQIVHISGHGREDGLILEDAIGREQVIPQTALADLFQAYSPPIQCVILNACYSISQGQLTSLGVPFTIAMEESISDEAAIEFSRGFYDAIGAGRTIDFAYEEGCRTVKLIAPDTPFVSQILVKDNDLKHFLLKSDHTFPHRFLHNNDTFPRGYFSIEFDRGLIAIKPAFYQSLKVLLDDLYISYLADQYKPHTYGSSWMLASRTRDFQLLIAPWNWLLQSNKGRPISSYNKTWKDFPLETYGLLANTSWQIIKPSEAHVHAFGLATNESKVTDNIYSYSPDTIKNIYYRVDELVPINTINPSDYNYFLVFTYRYSDHGSGGVIIFDKY